MSNTNVLYTQIVNDVANQLTVEADEDNEIDYDDVVVALRTHLSNVNDNTLWSIIDEYGVNKMIAVCESYQYEHEQTPEEMTPRDMCYYIMIGRVERMANDVDVSDYDDMNEPF